MKTQRIALVLLFAISLVNAVDALAQSNPWRFCRKSSDGSVIAIPSFRACDQRRMDITSSLVGPPGPVGLQGPQGPEGLQGPEGVQGNTGATGADGALRVYGDGSSGNVTVPDTPLSYQINFQFHDLKINPGQTLSVRSGTVIRCTGRFENVGYIYVYGADNGGQLAATPSSNTLRAADAPASPGISIRAAGNGEIGGAAADLTGGLGGAGIQVGSMGGITFRPPSTLGGGGGASIGKGGSGGGVLTILVEGELINDGAIYADGSGGMSGGGGGAGGMIVLASKTRIVFTPNSVLSVRGGNGANSGASFGPGGGGGGGLIHVITPQILPNFYTGVILREGGSPGGGSTQISSTVAAAGGGGGASFGNGGSGGNVPASRPSTATAAGFGATGEIYQNQFDPSSMF